MVTISELVLVYEPLLLELQVTILPKQPLDGKQLPLSPVVWHSPVLEVQLHADNANIIISQLSMLLVLELHAHFKPQQLVSNHALFIMLLTLLVQFSHAKPATGVMLQTPLDPSVLLAQLGMPHAQELLPLQQVWDGFQELDGQHALDQLLTTAFGQQAHQQPKLTLTVSLDTI